MSEDEAAALIEYYLLTRDGLAEQITELDAMGRLLTGRLKTWTADTG